MKEKFTIVEMDDYTQLTETNATMFDINNGAVSLQIYAAPEDMDPATVAQTLASLLADAGFSGRVLLDLDSTPDNP